MAKTTKSKLKSKIKPVIKTGNSNTVKLYVKAKNRVTSFLLRRPHRSFRMTGRREYRRSLRLPGYFAFTNYVVKTLWGHRRLFGLLALVSAVATALMVGVGSQDTYSAFRATLNATSGGLFSGVLGEVGKAGLLFAASATGGISQNLTDVQQVYAGIITILTWLTCVWFLRNTLAGHKVKLRDGIYSAGAPIVSTAIIVVVFMVQLLPLALAAIGYSAASASGLLSGGVEAMLFWVVAVLLTLLSLYWITSTIIALVIVTLPGMYPFTALKVAGDMVVGRRARVMYRLLWAVLNIVIVWALIMIPIILIDSWVKGLWTAISWAPIVPVVLLALSSITIVFASAYVYLLYRKVVDDDSEPA